MSTRAPRIALVAGEMSGDVLGEGLIRALSERYPEATFEGVAGPRMRAAGCRALADIDELSLFGLGEVVREIPRLLGLRRRLYHHFLNQRPDIFVGIDAPAFNTGLERRLRAADIATVHYVCPTAWAWRQGRVRKLREAVDLMLAIFPFEEEFFGRHRVPVRFVGHPLADRLPMRPDRAAARRALGLAEDRRWLALLPGSRGSELRRLGPAFIATAQWLARQTPELGLIAPMAGPELRQTFRAQLAAAAPELEVTLVDGRAQEVLAAADTALLASGTATLEALLTKTPMAVAYAVSPSTYYLMRGLRLLKVAHVSMPNLLAGRELVPEFLQQRARPEVMGPALRLLLESEPVRRAQAVEFERLHADLRRDADAGAAAAVAEILERRQ